MTPPLSSWKVSTALTQPDSEETRLLAATTLLAFCDKTLPLHAGSGRWFAHSVGSLVPRPHLFCQLQIGRY